MDGLLQWVVVDPLKPETYRQAEEMLRLPKCAGIKVHPEEHGYPIAEHGRAIFEFAAKHRAAVLGHSSEQNSLAADYVKFANDYPEVRLIIAHLGCGWDGDLTEAELQTIQLVGGAAIELEISGAGRDVGLGLVYRLAGIATLELGQFRMTF